MQAPLAHQAGGAAPGARWLRTAAVIVAAALQLVVLVPFTLASGLLAPLWAVITLFGVWVGFAAALVVVLRRRPLFAPLVPFANAAVLFGVLTLGGSGLGWTA